MSRYVKIYYGPSEEFYNLIHKPQKLNGLKGELNDRGYRVDLIPVECENYCRVVMSGNEVFRCNIRHLSFNTPASRDPICARAVAAVEDASAKLARADTYFWIEFLISELVFKRSGYSGKETWPCDVTGVVEMDCV